MNPLNFFRQNIFLKILSIFFAVVLWFFVVLEDKVEQVVEVVINCKHLSEKLVAVKPPPEKILVKVVGPRSILRNLTRHPVSLTLDLKDFGPGSHIITIHNKDLSLPGGLDVIGIEPKEFEIVLERLISRKVSVEPLLEGSPPFGWKVAKVEVKPNKVRIVGPESVILRLRKVKTKPIDISGCTGEVVKITEVDLPDQIKSVSPRLVKVKIKIIENIVEREIKDLPVKAIGIKKKVNLVPQSIFVRLKGPERILGPFAETKIEAIADLSNLQAGKHRVKIKLSIPAEVKVLKLRPKIVTVFIPK